jgi:hypothetical protein
MATAGSFTLLTRTDFHASQDTKFGCDKQNVFNEISEMSISQEQQFFKLLCTEILLCRHQLMVNEIANVINNLTFRVFGVMGVLGLTIISGRFHMP